jgi:hypothetical protein
MLKLRLTQRAGEQPDHYCVEIALDGDAYHVEIVDYH